MRRWLIGFGVAALLSVEAGCGAAVGGEWAEQAPAEPVQETVSLPYIVLSPSAEAQDVTERAADAWSRATGLDVAVGQGGIRVGFLPRIMAPTGDEVCALTRTLRHPDGTLDRTVSIELSLSDEVDCPGAMSALLHEIGHALTAPAIVGHGIDDHAPEGLFGPYGSDSEQIDEAAVVAVCSYADCGVIAL